jgi:hypothetical protein
MVRFLKGGATGTDFSNRQTYYRTDITARSQSHIPSILAAETKTRIGYPHPNPRECERTHRARTRIVIVEPYNAFLVGLCDGLKLEIQANAGNVVQRALSQVEPLQLMGEGILIAHSALISTRWNLHRNT